MKNLIFISIVFFLFGCQSTPVKTTHNISEIDSGMSPKEVRNLIGNPTEEILLAEVDGAKGFAWYYERFDASIEFSGDTVKFITLFYKSTSGDPNSPFGSQSPATQEKAKSTTQDK